MKNLISKSTALYPTTLSQFSLDKCRKFFIISQAAQSCESKKIGKYEECGSILSLNKSQSMMEENLCNRLKEAICLTISLIERKIDGIKINPRSY